LFSGECQTGQGGKILIQDTYVQILWNNALECDGPEAAPSQPGLRPVFYSKERQAKVRRDQPQPNQQLAYEKGLTGM